MPLTDLILNFRYSFFLGFPSRKHTIPPTASLACIFETSKASIRLGGIERFKSSWSWLTIVGISSFLFSFFLKCSLRSKSAFWNVTFKSLAFSPRFGTKKFIRPSLFNLSHSDKVSGSSGTTGKMISEGTKWVIK